MDPKIWGPPYWFFLHTMALNYPDHPNGVIKKKYYEFFKNLPEFLPSHSSRLRKLMETYPIAPYLDSRDSLVKWVHLIHNKINKQLDKPQVSLQKFYQDYHDLLHPPRKTIWTYGLLKKMVYSSVVILILLLILKGLTMS
jgi:hypothetical protein